MFCRFDVAKTLPKLGILDGEKVTNALRKEDGERKLFPHLMCASQILAQDDLLRQQKVELE